MAKSGQTIKQYKSFYSGQEVDYFVSSSPTMYSSTLLEQNPVKDQLIIQNKEGESTYDFLSRVDNGTLRPVGRNKRSNMEPHIIPNVACFGVGQGETFYARDISINKNNVRYYYKILQVTVGRNMRTGQNALELE